MVSPAAGSPSPPPCMSTERGIQISEQSAVTLSHAHGVDFSVDMIWFPGIKLGLGHTFITVCPIYVDSLARHGLCFKGSLDGRLPFRRWVESHGGKGK